jgi:hypothetical protein
MKIALCLSGQMRTFRECYPSLKKFILDPLKPDVFIYTDSYKGITREVENLEDFKNEKIGEEELKDLYEPKTIVVETPKKNCTEEIDGIKVPELLKQKEPKDYKGALPMFSQIYKCNELKKKWEKKNKFKYDLVIRLRPDIQFLEPLPKGILNNPEIVWYNNSENGTPCTPWQISDKFFLSNSKNMDYCCSVFTNLPRYWKKPLGNGKKGQHRVGERLMKYHLKKGNFKIKEFFSKCYILNPANFEEIRRKKTIKEKVKFQTRLFLTKSWVGKKLIDLYYLNISGSY